MMSRHTKVLLFVIGVVSLIPLSAFSHSGGTDSSGGHYNRKTGLDEIFEGWNLLIAENPDNPDLLKQAQLGKLAALQKASGIEETDFQKFLRELEDINNYAGDDDLKDQLRNIAINQYKAELNAKLPKKEDIEPDLSLAPAAVRGGFIVATAATKTQKEAYTMGHRLIKAINEDQERGDGKYTKTKSRLRNIGLMNVITKLKEQEDSRWKMLSATKRLKSILVKMRKKGVDMGTTSDPLLAEYRTVWSQVITEYLTSLSVAESDKKAYERVFSDISRSRSWTVNLRNLKAFEDSAKTNQKNFYKNVFGVGNASFLDDVKPEFGLSSEFEVPEIFKEEWDKPPETDSEKLSGINVVTDPIEIFIRDTLADGYSRSEIEEYLTKEYGEQDQRYLDTLFERILGRR